MTWQDPAAVALALALIGLSFWWRHRLLSKGKAPHCTQCVADHRRNAKLAQGARSGGGGFMNSPKFKKIR